MANPDVINAITKAILSVIVVGGGFVFLFLKPEAGAAIAPTISIVVAYYFLQARADQSAKTAAQEVVNKQGSAG